MDLRVLVAVFVTLFGIAVGMGQGQIDAATLQNVLDDIQSAGDLNTLLEERTKKNANITAEGRFTSASSIDLSLTAPTTLTVAVEPATRISFGGSEVRTRTAANLTMAGFRGSVTVDENVSIDGTATRLETPFFTFNASTAKPVSLAAETVGRVAVDGMKQQNLQFENATGRLTAAGGNNIKLEEDTVILTAFTGSLSIQPATRTYTLNGKIFKAEVPTYPVTIGGE